MAGRPHEVEPIPGGYPPGAEPFLGAIVAHRADDTARLVFADWLQENGDEDRAEFIRDQIALHRSHPSYQQSDEATRRATFSSTDHERYARQHKLLGQNIHLWLNSMTGGSRVHVNPGFQRGFPDSVDLAPEEWLKYGEWLRRWAPLERVHLDGQGRPFSDLMTQPTLFGLSELSLNRVGTEELRELADSSVLDTLESLTVQGRSLAGTVEVPALRRLFGSTRLKRLRSLRVWIDRAGDTLGFVVGGSPHLRNLGHLDLSDAMRYEAARDLFDSPNLANVTDLALPNNPMGDVAIRGLVRSKYLTRLTTLRLNDAALTTESGRLLAGWPGLRTLTLLYLNGNELGFAGVRALSESPYLGQLRWLAISDNVPREEVEPVTRLPGFAHIPHLF
jgi:uncharacterized protein (TIGR02996 family)